MAELYPIQRSECIARLKELRGAPTTMATHVEAARMMAGFLRSLGHEDVANIWDTIPKKADPDNHPSPKKV